MKKRFICLLAIILVGLFAIIGLSQETQTIKQGAITVTKTYQPVKRLDFEVEVNASPKEIWSALTTSEGLKTWLAPEVKVELKKGGDWVVVFNGASAGGGTITDFIPGKSLTIAAMAPESFPTVRRERTTAVFEVKPTSNPKTSIVRLTQTGWKTGEEWDKAFNYLAKGNAELLDQLRQRYISGPFDWDAIFKRK